MKRPRNMSARVAAGLLAVLLTAQTPVSLLADEPALQASQTVVTEAEEAADAKEMESIVDAETIEDAAEAEKVTDAADAEKKDAADDKTDAKKPETAGDKTDAKKPEMESDKTDAEKVLDTENAPAQEEAGKREFDVDAPVIESFTFAENGKTVNGDDLLHFEVKAYDLGSGIDSVSVRIEDANGYSNWEIMDFTEKDGVWMAEWSAYLPSGNFYIGDVFVRDANGNSAAWTVRDDEWKPLYSFSVEREGSITQLAITDITLDATAAPLKLGDSVTIAAKITGNAELGAVWAGLLLEDENGNYPGWERVIPLNYGESTGKYEGIFTVEEKTYPGKWVLKYMSVADQNGYQTRYAISEEHSFVVEQENFDTEAPVIKSISIGESQGKILEAGDTVEVTVVAEDNDELDEYACVYFTNWASSNSRESIILRYDTAAGAYKGNFEITEKTYPGEWVLDWIDVRDASGNSNLYDPGLDYSAVYFRVMQDGDYVERTYKVHLQFHALDSYGNYMTVATKDVENVPVRTTVAELVESFPEADYGESTFLGWYYYKNNEKCFVEEDSEVYLGTYGSLDEIPFDFYAAYDKYPVTINKQYYRKDGTINWETITGYYPLDTPFEEIIDTVESPDTVLDSGIKFQGWKYDSAYENQVVGEWGNWIQLVGTYDSYSLYLHEYYLDSDGTVRYKDGGKITCQAGKMWKDVLDTLDAPEDGRKGFKSWQVARDENQEIGLEEPSLSIYATYEGVTTLYTELNYCDEKNGWMWQKKGITLEGDLTYEEKVAEAQKIGANMVANVSHYPGMKPGKHSSYVREEGKGFAAVYVYQEYENCMVTLELPSGKREYHVVDRGTTFTLPNKVTGYKDIKWRDTFDHYVTTFVVDSDRFVYATSWTVDDGVVTEPEKPSEPETPSKPEKPAEPIAPVKPEAPSTGGSSNQNVTPSVDAQVNVPSNLPQNVITETASQITSAAPGTAVKVNMAGATVVPKDILASAKGKDVDVVLDMGGYQWTINGKDIAASDLKDINLEMKLDTNAVPSRLVNQIAGGQPTRQLSLTHNGNFGFKARLTLNVGSENAGQYGNLYYYDSTGKMVFQNAGRINADGTVNITFSHASDYVLVISDHTAKSPKTGEQAPMVPLAVMLMAVVAVTGFGAVRRKRS